MYTHNVVYMQHKYLTFPQNETMSQENLCRFLLPVAALMQ